MKVLMTVGGFYPAKNFGGPATSIYNICDLLCKTIDIVVVTANHDLNSTEPLDGVAEGKNENDEFSVYYLSEKNINYRNFAEIADTEKPDIVYVNSLFSGKYFVPFLKYTKKRGLPLLLAPRGELCDNAFRKRTKKLIYINVLKMLYGMENVSIHVTAENEVDGVKRYLGIPDDRIYQIENIPTRRKTGKERLDKKCGEAHIVFLSRIHPKKNLLFAINVLANIHGKVFFDVYGPIEDQEYWAACKKAIDDLPKNIQVRHCGFVEHSEVQTVLSKYDAMFFPTLSENYGHVIAEALLADCPVITSDQVPWTDMPAYECGYAIPLDDVKAYEKAVNDVVGWEKEDIRKVAEHCEKYIAHRIDFDELRKKYSSMFSEIAKR